MHTQFIRALAACIILALAGCTARYEEKGAEAFAPGYTEKRTAEGRYWLRFIGTGADSHERIETLWYRRADELCGPGNYSAAPQRRTEIHEEPRYYGYAVIMEEVRIPYIEGSVDCTDRDLASDEGAERYNPAAGATKFRIGEIRGASGSIRKNTLRSLNYFLKEELSQRGLLAGDAGESATRVSVTVMKFRTKSAASANFGLMLGSDAMTSEVEAHDPASATATRKEQVETTLWVGNPDRNRLMAAHARDIADFLTGTPPE